MTHAHTLKPAARLGALALACLALGGAAAFAQAPATTPAAPAASGRGYDDPGALPLRTPNAEEPVWARPAVDMLATIRTRGTLRIGVVANEPFVMHDAKGELVGFSIDLGRQLAADMGVEAEFVPTSWSQIVPDLIARHFDVAATGLWITPARALVVNFTEATSVGAMHLVASKALSGSAKSIDDFNTPEVKLVVMAGTSQEAVASRTFPRATLVKVQGDADPLAPVLEGKANALIVTTPTPYLVVRQAPDKLFQPLEQPLQVTRAAMAIRKGDADFLNFLNSWLTFHREGGWLDERERYWLGTDWLTGM
ncbi:amino acid ABC transporter substrate-binding protein [Luteitalea sp. TBR-22]|uniref:transporter substrate-binding domain-containing protein n=1 Tax=Luteitalea sp. TBR-22 TaxID=2802971 RepID=UPI001AF40231|nr:transporter substrate-binding domain-containing protein [Luteitalea sp. TBR-22]BCS31816.1 amino acid ABC transporter substrate-binding protein [Luteitalea sp. TBR-22]